MAVCARAVASHASTIKAAKTRPHFDRKMSVQSRVNSNPCRVRMLHWWQQTTVNRFSASREGPPGRSAPARGIRLHCKSMSDSEKKGVLFVCLGNICRSPTAEAMFRAVTERSGVADKFDVDSCGTGGGNPTWYRPSGWSYHEGEESDERMKAAAAQRGVFLTSLSRPLKPDDFQRFDTIVAMDAKNKRDITEAVEFWAVNPQNMLDKEACLAKVTLMCDYCTRSDAKEVPDPYYGGPSGFDTVLDLLEDACEGLLGKLG